MTKIESPGIQTGIRENLVNTSYTKMLFKLVYQPFFAIQLRFFTRLNQWQTMTHNCFPPFYA